MDGMLELPLTVMDDYPTSQLSEHFAASTLASDHRCYAFAASPLAACGLRSA
jgi:hypothetical protein